MTWPVYLLALLLAFASVVALLCGLAWLARRAK
jgi:hypothetical protein